MDYKLYALLLHKIREAGGDTYTKEEIDEMISQLKQFECEYVEQLPTSNIKPNCIYFVPRSTPSSTDGCYEYMWINDQWEFLGTTEVDLSDYWTSDETKQYVDDNAYVLPEATESTLGGVKLSTSGSVQMDENGHMVITTVDESEIEDLFNAH